MKKLQKSWYKKWWAIALFIFFGLIIIGGFSDKNNPTPQIKKQSELSKVEDESIVQDAEITADAITKKLDYQIVYEISNNRYDGGKNFYVLVDKIDLQTADFKNEIKKMVDEVVRQKGQKISIDFINDRAVLDLIHSSHYGKNTLGRILTKAETDKVGDALVAQFSGQLEANIYLNTLSFFPGTFTDNPRVGKYVETIEYNPSK